MVHDPSGGADLELPDDWADQITRAYEVFGVEEFARHITPRMRAAWARMRRRGKGFGGGQWMPNIVARIPLHIPVDDLEPGPETPVVVIIQGEEEEEEPALPLFSATRRPRSPESGS